MGGCDVMGVVHVWVGVVDGCGSCVGGCGSSMVQ